MNFRTSVGMRAKAAAAVLTVVAATGIVLATTAPAHAQARCTADGKPKWSSGKFRNNTDQTMMVKGDRYVGNGKFKTVEVPVRKDGGTAWDAGVCDVDYIKTYWDFYYINRIVDGDSWHKITGSWSCWNAPGSGFRIACG